MAKGKYVHISNRTTINLEMIVSYHRSTDGKDYVCVLAPGPDGKNCYVVEDYVARQIVEKYLAGERYEPDNPKSQP